MKEDGTVDDKLRLNLFCRGMGGDEDIDILKGLL